MTDDGRGGTITVMGAGCALGAAVACLLGIGSGVVSVCSFLVMLAGAAALDLAAFALGALGWVVFAFFVLAFYILADTLIGYSGLRGDEVARRRATGNAPAGRRL